jgi:hypothetical protein
MLQRREQIHRYRAEIRKRIPSGGGAQVSVAANLFRGLVAREFSVDQDVREIADLVESFIDTLSDRNRMDLLKVEALIRSTLGETTVFIEDIEFGERSDIYLGVSAFIIHRRGISEPEIVDLIVRAEQDAQAQGVALVLA